MYQVGNPLNIQVEDWIFPGKIDRGHTAQNIKFSIKDFFSKCDQIRRKLQIRSHLLKKFLMKNFHFLYSVKNKKKGLPSLFKTTP